MIRFHLTGIAQDAVLHRDKFCIGLVELNDKPVLEIIRYASTVAGSIAHQLMIANDFHIGTFVEGVDDDICLRGLREGELHDDSPFCGGELCSHIVIG